MDISRYRKSKGSDQPWADWLSDDMPEPAAAPVRPDVVAPAPVRPMQRPGRPNAYQNLVRTQAPVAPPPPIAQPPAPQFRRPPQPVVMPQPNSALAVSTPPVVLATHPQALSAPLPLAAPAPPPPPQPAYQPAQPLRQQRRARPVRSQPQPAPAAAETDLPWSTAQKPAVQAAPTPTPVAPAAVSIQIQIPSVSRKQITQAAQKRAQRTKRFVGKNKKRVGIATTVTALVLLGLFAPPLLKFGRGLVQTKQPASAPVAAKLGYAKPPFDVVTPSSKPQLGTPDGTHSAYDAKKQSYSYADSIGGKQVTVSEQQIPAGDTAASIVPQAAKSFNATSPIKTGWGTAYIQTNQKYNSQIVVFGVKGVLVFIQSGFTLTNDQWTTYINALT